jgi:hypothetical protein
MSCVLATWSSFFAALSTGVVARRVHPRVRAHRHVEHERRRRDLPDHVTSSVARSLTGWRLPVIARRARSVVVSVRRPMNYDGRRRLH